MDERSMLSEPVVVLLIFVVGFATGYGVRAWRSWRRRQRFNN